MLRRCGWVLLLLTAGVAWGVSAAENVLTIDHAPAQPRSGQPVTVTARLGRPVAQVALEVQIVEPGNYVRRSDRNFGQAWRELAMNDRGVEGDPVAGDGRHTAVVPGDWQQHRRLMRYRIKTTESGGAATRFPATTNACPNFAYFVYDGIPAWTGAVWPGRTPPLTFSAEFMKTLPAYHLIARWEDVERSQWNPSASEQQFAGALVYDGQVYDHIRFRIRGRASMHVAGKNKWGIKFNETQLFRDRDLRGRPLKEGRKSISLNACASPWAPVNRGMAGMDEAVSFRAYQLAGVPAADTHWIQFRVIARPEESSTANQYEGDLWGLYLVVEEPSGAWLREHGWPNGDVVSPESGVKHSLGSAETTQAAFGKFMLMSQSSRNESWWRANLDLPAYYSFHALNRVLGNIDLRPQANHYLYRPPDGHWCVVPWDLDMMFIARTHQPGYVDQAQCLESPALHLEYQSRAREILDLFCADARPNGGQIGQLVNELAQFLTPTNQARTWPELDQCLWNDHPRSHARGQFYRTPFRDSRFGGTWIRTLATPDFAGFCRYIVDYCTDSRPTKNYQINDGDQRGYGYGFLSVEANDPLIPERPVIRLVGEPAGSFRQPWRLEISPFRGAEAARGAKFAATQWRVGEIRASGLPGYQTGEPFRYELEELWRSVPLTKESREYELSEAPLKSGHTYRVRARHRDSSGRWSHWSEPVRLAPK